MQVPDGYTETEVLGLIEYVCSKLAPQFVFGYYDLDDLKQEIRIFCLESLSKYERKRGKLSTFFMVVATRKLVNFRRDHLYRMPPTCSCKNCLSGIECDYQKHRMAKWCRLNTVKRNLMNINHMGDDDYEDALVVCDSGMKEIVELIDENLDVLLREDYRKMIEGVSVSKKTRDKIITEIHSILERADYEV